jgi:hypothetical protein
MKMKLDLVLNGFGSKFCMQFLWESNPKSSQSQNSPWLCKAQQAGLLQRWKWEVGLGKRCNILWPPPPDQGETKHGHSGTVTFLSEEDLFEMHFNRDNDKFWLADLDLVHKGNRVIHKVTLSSPYLQHQCRSFTQGVQYAYTRSDTQLIPNTKTSTHPTLVWTCHEGQTHYVTSCWLLLGARAGDIDLGQGFTLV